MKSDPGFTMSDILRRIAAAVSVIILAAVCMTFIPFIRFSAVAGEDASVQETYAGTEEESAVREAAEYTTYVVQTGDTLWGIADSRLNERYSTHSEYIWEVMRANGLTDSFIYDGELIIIPSYD